MSFPLSPPPSRSSSQTSFYKSQFTTSTHNPSYSTPVSPPASHHMHNALAKPRLPILSVPPAPLRGTSASPAPESGYGSSTVLKSFFSPCSSDEDEEEGEKQTPNSSFELNSATRSSTRKPIRGHFSRLWASHEAPSPPPKQRAPEPASEEEEEEEEDGEVPVGRRVSVPGKLKLKVLRRSKTAVVSEFGYKQFLPMSGDDDDEDEDDYNYYNYDTPLNDEKQTPPTQGWPIRGSSITTAKRNYLPKPPQQQQPDLQQHTTSRTPLYYHGTEIPPPHRPHSQRSQKQQLDSLESSETLAKHQTFTSSLLSTKSHALQARISLSDHLNSQPTTSSSNLITALATLHSSLANTESLYLETLTAAAPHTTTTAAALQEARRKRDYLLVQTQKAHLRKSSVRRIHHLHAQLQDSEQALKQAEFKAAREEAEEMFWKEVEAVEERALMELEVARGLRRSFGGIGLTGAAGVVRNGEELVKEEEEEEDEEDEREKRREKRECWSWSESERSHFSSDEDDDDDNEEGEEQEEEEKEEEVVRTDTLRSTNRTIPRSVSTSNSPFTPEKHHHHQHNHNSLPIPFSIPPPLSLTTSTTTANLLPSLLPFKQNQKTQRSPLGFRRGTFGFYESGSESEDEDEPENQQHVHEKQTEETEGLGIAALGAEVEVEVEVEGLTGGGLRGGRRGGGGVRVREEEVEEEEEVFCTARVARVGVPVLVAMI